MSIFSTPSQLPNITLANTSELLKKHYTSVVINATNEDLVDELQNTVEMSRVEEICSSEFYSQAARIVSDEILKRLNK